MSVQVLQKPGCQEEPEGQEGEGTQLAGTAFPWGSRSVICKS